MKNISLMFSGLLAGALLLVGLSYFAIYFRLFEASFLLRPVTVKA